MCGVLKKSTFAYLKFHICIPKIPHLHTTAYFDLLIVVYNPYYGNFFPLTFWAKKCFLGEKHQKMRLAAKIFWILGPLRGGGDILS